MDFLDVSLQVLCFVNTLMKIVEGLFGKGEGKVKKELVMVGAKTFVHNMQDVSTGGQKEFWTRNEAPLSKVIDATATMLFPKVTDGLTENFIL